MLTPTFNQTRQFQCQHPLIKGIMGLREPAFGFQLAYDLHRDLRPFAVLQLMDAIVQHFQQALPCLRHLFITLFGCRFAEAASAFRSFGSWTTTSSPSTHSRLDTTAVTTV